MLNKLDFSNSINLTTIKLPADLVYQNYINKHFTDKYNNKDFLKTVINESSLKEYSDLQKIYKLFENSFAENQFYKIAIDEITKLELPDKQKIITKTFEKFFNDKSNIKYNDVCSMIKTLKDNNYPEKKELIRSVASSICNNLFITSIYNFDSYPFCENDVDIFLKQDLSDIYNIWKNPEKTKINSAIFYNLTCAASNLDFPDKDKLLGDFINKNFDLILSSAFDTREYYFKPFMNENNINLISKENFIKYIDTYRAFDVFNDIKHYNIKNKNEYLKLTFKKILENENEFSRLSDYKFMFKGVDKDLRGELIKDNLDLLLDEKHIDLTLEIIQNLKFTNKEEIFKEFLSKISEKMETMPESIYEKIDSKYFGNFINDNLNFFTSSERITNTLKFIKKLDYENKNIALGKIFNIFLNSPGYNINTFFDTVLKNDVKENIDLLDEKSKIITFKISYENNNAEIEIIKEQESGYINTNLLSINAKPNEINKYLVKNIIESLPKKHKSSGFVIDVQDKDFFYITNQPELLKNISKTANKKYFVDHNNLYVMQSKENFNNFDNYQNKKTSSLQSLTAIFTMNAEKIKHFDTLCIQNEEKIDSIDKKEELINKINEYVDKCSLLCEKISSDNNLENDEFKNLIDNKLQKSINNFLNVANEDIILQKDTEKVFNTLNKYFSLINKSITSFSLISSQNFEFNNETKKMLDEQRENTKEIISNVSKEIEDDINAAFFNASLDQSATIAAYNILIKNDDDFVIENREKQ